jgi:hypothetical protein
MTLTEAWRFVRVVFCVSLATGAAALASPAGAHPGHCGTAFHAQDVRAAKGLAPKSTS